MYPLTTILIKIWHLSHKETYTPLALILAKICLIANQFTIFIQNETYKPYKVGSVKYLFTFFALSSSLLHLVICLNWFIVQWFDKNNSAENWRFILMSLCCRGIWYLYCHLATIRMHNSAKLVNVDRIQLSKTGW